MTLLDFFRRVITAWHSRLCSHYSISLGMRLLIARRYRVGRCTLCEFEPVFLYNYAAFTIASWMSDDPWPPASL